MNLLIRCLRSGRRHAGVVYVSRYLFFFVLLSLKQLAFSQAADSNPLKFDVIPPSPEAIGKYVDNPVSTYTDVPKIDNPIYTLKLYGLTLSKVD